MREDRTRSQREWLSRPQIEERAALLLQYVFPDRSGDHTPPDLEKVVDILQSKYGVQFAFREDLGGVPGVAKILGMFSVAPLTIRVCSSLEPWSPGFCKTLAHELGHLVLHRTMIGDGKYISRDKPIVDTALQLRYRETAELSDLGWVEWQANEFAMSLILPRAYLQCLVYAVQMEIGVVTGKLGSMYLDDQACNQRDCRRIVAGIAERSGATEALIWRRLRFLGILEDHQRKRARPIFEALDALFDSQGQHPAAPYSEPATRSPQG